MNQMLNAIAEPVVQGEVNLAYEVEIRAIGPTQLLSDDGRAVLQELMDRAKSAALDVLDGLAEPVPVRASVAARLQIAIDRWDQLARAEKLAAHSPVQDDALTGAHRAAKEAFEDAFNILITCFEKEFPRGSEQ